MPTAEKGILHVEGHELTITNPEKPLWPEAGITKLMYLEKLAALSPYLIPYCRGRFLTVIRFPHGVHGKSFYQKNAPEPLPPFVGTAQSGDIRHVRLDNLPTLLWLGNLAALEFHPSCERIGSAEPSEWILDIDPPREGDPRLMEAVGTVGEVLESLGIAAVPKTSGATGAQIFVPLREGCTFRQLRALGEFVGKYLAEKYPALFTLERLKKDRGNRIYFDYLQHWPGKTLAAPYTPRATPSATVSAPLTWDEVRRNADPASFNLLTIEKRLETHGDLIRRVPPQDLGPILKFIGKSSLFPLL